MATSKTRKMLYMQPEFADALQAVADADFGGNFTSACEYLLQTGLEDYRKSRLERARRIVREFEEMEASASA